MSRPKLLNTSIFPNARALILVSKHFYIWGIMVLKFFKKVWQSVQKSKKIFLHFSTFRDLLPIDAIKINSDLVGGFGVIPVFHFLEILKNFSFLGLSREPFDIR